MSDTEKKTLAESEAEAAGHDQGRELFTVIEVRPAGKPDAKPLSAEPKDGSYEIRMRQGMRYGGYRAAAIKELEKSFPKCKFAWAADA